MFNNDSMRKGFTLVELVVVVSVVGLMTTVVLVLLNPAAQFKKARDAKRKADLAQISAAFELYRSDQGSYPASIPSCGGTLAASGINYLRNFPCDPINSGQLRYNFVMSGSPPNSYSLIVCLENVNDRGKDVSNATAYCSGGSSNWSYTVFNP